MAMHDHICGFILLYYVVIGHLLWPGIMGFRYHHILRSKQTNHDQAKMLAMMNYDKLGFSDRIKPTGFHLPSQIIYGSNAIEHGINLLSSITKNVVILTGWNQARVTDLMWDLEPRSFQIKVFSVDSMSVEYAELLIDYIVSNEVEAIMAVGGGSVLNTAKMIMDILIMNQQKVPYFVSLASLPSNGGETHAYYSCFDHSNTTQPISYRKSKAVDLCIVQPAIYYNTQGLLVYSRLVGMVGLAIDIILSDCGFVAEVLAYESLKQLMPILDRFMQVSTLRMADIHINPKRFFELTIHDDASEHRSQFVRRYGNNLQTKDIDEISRVGISLSSARTNLIVSPLHVISESILLDATREGDNLVKDVCLSHVIPELLPAYVRYLDIWTKSSNNADENDQAYKEFLAMKLQEISSILSTSVYLSPRIEDQKDVVYSMQDLMNNMEKVVIPMVYICANYPSTSGLSKEHLQRWSSTAASQSIHNLIQEHSPDSPVARMASASFNDMSDYLSKCWSESMLTASKQLRGLLEVHGDRLPEEGLAMRTVHEDEIEFLEELEDESTLNLTKEISDDELWQHLRRRAAEREAASQPSVD
jgi:hypothetical protein